MKNILVVVFCLLSVTIGKTQNVGIGSPNPTDNAIIEMVSNENGIVIPRMDSLGRTLITAPAQGLMIYQMDKQTGFYYYTGTSWKSVSDDTHQNEGSRMTAPGVGIGTTNPDNPLQIVGGDNATLSAGTGYMTLGNIPGTNMVLDNNGIQVRTNSAAANLRLQDYGGNVYIDNPGATLYVRGTEDISLTDDEGLAIFGPTTGANIAIDNNEIMARNNGNRTTLYLQNEGGDTNIGGNLIVDSLIQGRVVFDPNIEYLSSGSGLLDISNNTYIRVVATENPTPSIFNISGATTAGRMLIIQNHDDDTDWILEESLYINLTSSSITMNGRDIIFLISDGYSYNQIAYVNN